jgi:AraC-like DNA-binding protein
MADALTKILESVRMEGSVFSRAELTAPWGVESGSLAHGVFHAVVAGRAWVALAGGEATEIERGDVVWFPYGDNHVITDAPDRPTRNIGLLTAVDERGMGRLEVDGGGAATSLICGRVSFERSDAHPVLSRLPSIIHVRDDGGRMVGTLDALIDLISAEIDDPSVGSGTIVARLTDALVAYVLRDYIGGLQDREASWLRALKDPQIAAALDVMHGQPERPWTIGSLASAAGLSRSVFFARFKTLVGESPAAYLTRWRIHLAARMLREEGSSVATTARRVGYATEAAFSNAFLRVMGVRPGAYKRAA